MGQATKQIAAAAERGGQGAIRGRLAPSPTGALHLGNARSLLLAWLSARSQGGRVILRIEDLEHPKVKAGAAAGLLEDLRWLGLDWDEGPYVQSERLVHYAAALTTLRAAGRVYPCVCSRRDVQAGQAAPHAEDLGPPYPGTCQGRFPDYAAACATLPPNRLPAWRFRARPGVVRFADHVAGPCAVDVAATAGDFVLARQADGAGYMLAVTVDDAAMGISEVVRGADLLSVSAWQIQVQEALNLPRPRYAHPPLVVGPDGRRLAKRHGDTRLAWLREQGVPPERVVGLLVAWSGLAPWGRTCRPADCLPAFAWDRLPREPAVLDQRAWRALGIAPPS